MDFATIDQIMTHFNTNEKCIKHLAQIRWPDGAVCQHCGGKDKISYLSSREVWWCGVCRKQFSVRIGTVFEGSRVPLQKWFAAIWLATSHEKGISPTQLAKDISVTQKTAGFMFQKISETIENATEEVPSRVFNRHEHRHKQERNEMRKAASTLTIPAVNGGNVRVLIRKHNMNKLHIR